MNGENNRGLERFAQVKIPKETIDTDNCFLSMITQMQQGHIVTDSADDAMQEQVYAILEDAVWMHTRGTSSSIPEEEAAELLKGIIYTLDTFCLSELRQSDSGDGAAAKLIEPGGIRRCYDAGRKQLTLVKKHLTALYGKVMKSKVPTTAYIYNETMINLTTTVKNCETNLMPHKIKPNPTYELMVQNKYNAVGGVYFLREYLYCLSMENALCAFFMPQAINRLIFDRAKQCSVTIRDITENIAAMVLQNACFSGELVISDAQARQIVSRLSSLKLPDYLSVAYDLLQKLCSSLHIADSPLREYVLSYKYTLRERIKSAVTAYENGDIETAHRFLLTSSADVV